MSKRSIPIVLSIADMEQLKQWEQAHETLRQVGLRCRIILGAAEGEDSQNLADRLQINRHTANLWRRRVSEQGVGAVWEVAPGRGRKPVYDIAKRDGIIEAALQTKPEGQTHRSCRTMAKALDRTQPGLPLKKGRCGTYTHDYKRNGTTTLFAALDVPEGKVIGQCRDREK